MFDRLFRRPQAVARHRNGPLAEERLRFLVHCEKQQMSPVTLGHITRNTLIVAKVLRLANSSPEPKSKPRPIAGSSAPGVGRCTRSGSYVACSKAMPFAG